MTNKVYKILGIDVVKAPETNRCEGCVFDNRQCIDVAEGCSKSIFVEAHSKEGMETPAKVYRINDIDVVKVPMTNGCDGCAFTKSGSCTSAEECTDVIFVKANSEELKQSKPEQKKQSI